MKSSTTFKKGHKQLNSGRTHFKKGFIPWNKGKKGVMPPVWCKGKKLSDEVKEKISNSLKGRTAWNKGKGKPLPKCKVCGIELKNHSNVTCMKHKTLSEETKKKIGDSTRGEKNWNWKGGYENVLYHNRLRRIRKKGNGGFHTQGEWENLKAQYNWTCPCCGKSEPEITLSLDHIIPISKGGSNNIENIQPLCRSCNSKKQTKIIRFNKKTL